MKNSTGKQQPNHCPSCLVGAKHTPGDHKQYLDIWCEEHQFWCGNHEPLQLVETISPQLRRVSQALNSCSRVTLQIKNN